MQNNVFAGKSVLIFDWDGTLFDSMPTKYRTFSETVAAALVAENPEVSVDKVREIYIRHSGLPRQEIFRITAGHFNLLLTQRQMDDMSAALSARNASELRSATLFPDAVRLLNALENAPYRLYISSSVPQAELDSLASHALSQNLHSRFSGILGSRPGFSKGREHVNYICRSEYCQSGACIMIGDDEADMRLSRDAGIASKRIDRLSSGTQDTIGSLEDLIAWL